jgi:galactose mutarotase-like enzyme
MAVETIEYLGRKLHRWNVGPSSFLVAPELGARLMNWHITMPDGTVREVIHWPEMKSYADFHKVRGGNPVLFPFSARTFDQGEIHMWRDTEGARRHMPMHGIARQGKFELTRLHDQGFTALFKPAADDAAIYPYDYEFTVSYRFGPLNLSVEFALHNRDRQPVPWSAGHHFYFAVPWREHTTRGDYLLDLQASKAVRQKGDGSLQPDEPSPGPVPLDHPSLVDRLHHGLRSNLVRVTSGDQSLLIRVGTDPVPPEWATVVTWAESATSPYFCIEPWMGPPNSPEHKIGYHLVRPKQTQKFVVEVAVT